MAHARTSEPEEGPHSSPSLERSLSLPALVVYGLAYVAPITFFTTFGVATERSGGPLQEVAARGDRDHEAAVAVALGLAALAGMKGGRGFAAAGAY